MARMLALAALVLLAGVSVAFCQSAPDRSPRHARQVDKAASVPPPDPVTWMGKAIDDILTGKVVDDLTPPSASERR